MESGQTLVWWRVQIGGKAWGGCGVLECEVWCGARGGWDGARVRWRMLGWAFVGRVLLLRIDSRGVC